MNLLKRIFGLETRDRALSHADLFLRGEDLNVGVTAGSAENLGTVLACVNAISSAMASLPAWVYRRTGSGREVVEDHPLMRLVRRGPNQFQSWPDWIEWTMAQVLLRGNAVSEVVTDGAGRLSGLRPIPWENVSVQLLPSGRLAYDVVEARSEERRVGKESCARRQA